MSLIYTTAQKLGVNKMFLIVYLIKNIVKTIIMFIIIIMCV